MQAQMRTAQAPKGPGQALTLACQQCERRLLTPRHSQTTATRALATKWASRRMVCAIDPRPHSQQESTAQGSDAEDDSASVEVRASGSGQQPAKSQDPGSTESSGVRAALCALRWYKDTVSPILPRACRFLPTCSEYSMQAYREFGVTRGTVLTAWRLLRCNPLNLAVRYQGKYDPPVWPPVGFQWLSGRD